MARKYIISLEGMAEKSGGLSAGLHMVDLAHSIQLTSMRRCFGHDGADDILVTRSQKVCSTALARSESSTLPSQNLVSLVLPLVLRWLVCTRFASS
jgi:hypothetical protein